MFKILILICSVGSFVSRNFLPWCDVTAMNPGSDITLVYIYIPHLEQNYQPFSSFRWRLSRIRLTINATTYTLPERSFRDLSGNVWFVASIVYRFRDKRQKLAYTLARTFFYVNLA